MTERRDAVRRSARAPLQQRSRKRWTVAAGLAVCWGVLLELTGSVFGATVVLAVLVGVSVAGAVFLKTMGVTRDHPWIRWMAARPWRDGQDVLKLALRHLPDVFVITPSGALIAPNAVDLWLNPDDLSSVTERMDLDLVNSSAAEVYEEQVAAHGARFAGPGLASVRVIADPSLPPGRYQLRQGQPVDAGREPAYAAAAAQPAYAAPPAAAQPAYAAPPAAAPARPQVVSASRRHEPGRGPYPGFVGHDGNTRAQPEHGATADTGMLTVVELSRSPVPTLRLVTDGKVTETRMSGARAGRGPVELKLPGVPTISREHARFTFSDGRWWIANLGRNGLTLNGSPLAGEQPLSNGDSIRWGSRSDSLLTWVEIS
jgi:FHA domain